MSTPSLSRAHAGPDWVRTALDVLGVGLIVLYLGVFVVRNVSIQGDFRTYLAAARAPQMGLDPYEPRTLASIAGRPMDPFVYPPLVLAAFRPLATVHPSVAAALWIGLKIALLAGLMFVWLRWFVPGVGLLPLALIAVFGWNEAALWDLRTGNVALLECGLLWTAFACFVAGRRAAFTGLVVAGACFKLLPALFLLLLLVPTQGKAPSPRHLLAGLVLLAVLVWGPTVIGPASHWERFFRHIPDARTLGESNPGALGFATVLAAAARITQPGASWAATSAWLAYALALLAASIPFLRKVWRERDPRIWVMTAVFLFVLLEPRPMAYGFVLMAPAPLFFAPKVFRRPAGELLLALAVSAQGLFRAANQHSDSLLYTYSPALLTPLVWFLILESESRDPNPRGAALTSDRREALAA
jgi:hypothetical protein